MLRRPHRSRTARRALNTPLSQNARLTFHEMASHASPHTLPEEVFKPTIHQAISDALAISVRVRVQHGNEHIYIPPITLMKAENAELAYARIQKPGRRIEHRKGNAAFTGELFFATCYYRVMLEQSNVFQAPSPENAEYVAIKKINKLQLGRYLEEGGHENPYKEIERMRELGDNQHVIACVEALEDDTFLYIVTPMACSEGTLADYVRSIAPQTVPVDRARQLFRQILEILLYLDAHGICHRDLSPDNLIFLTPTNLVAMDLAMSVRNPRDESGRRLLSPPQGTFGTLPFMPPEILNDRFHDGLAVDVWAAALNLYFMLTGRLLYSIPHPVDPHFNFFILAGGLSDSPIQESTVEVVMDAPGPISDHLLQLVEVHRSLEASARQVLQQILTVAVWDRWTLAQVAESDFVQGRA